MLNIITLLNTLNEISAFDKEMPLRWVQCFLIIMRNEGLTIKEIAEELDIEHANASRIIDSLANSKRSGTPYGWVYKKKNEDDGRSYRIYLTRAGKRCMQSINQKMTYTSVGCF